MPLSVSYNITKVKVATEPESNHTIQTNRNRVKTMILNSIITTGLVQSASAVMPTTGASVSAMLDPIFLLAETELLSIGKRLCVAALMVCGIKYSFASDPQNAKTAKDWGLRILVGLIIMILAGDIIPLFVDMIAAA